MIKAEYKSCVRKFLNDRSLRFAEVEGAKRWRVHIGFSGLHGFFGRLKVILALDEDVVQVVVPLPIRIPLAENVLMDRMVGYITRLNYNLKCGKFEVGYVDGTVRYQFGQHVAVLEESNLAASVLDAMIYQSILFVDRVSRGFRDVLETVASPEQIFRNVWNAPDGL